jgi:hypothetical protein
VRGNERRLDDYLRDRLKRALDELVGIDPDVILTENADVVVASLLGKHMPAEIKIDWDGATRSPVVEVTTQVRDQPEPAPPGSPAPADSSEPGGALIRQP